jgi:hypothetical protein
MQSLFSKKRADDGKTVGALMFVENKKAFLLSLSTSETLNHHAVMLLHNFLEWEKSTLPPPFTFQYIQQKRSDLNTECAYVCVYVEKQKLLRFPSISPGCWQQHH